MKKNTGSADATIRWILGIILILLLFLGRHGFEAKQKAPATVPRGLLVKFSISYNDSLSILNHELVHLIYRANHFGIGLITCLCDNHITHFFC